MDIEMVNFAILLLEEDAFVCQSFLPAMFLLIFCKLTLKEVNRQIRVHFRGIKPNVSN